MKTLFIVIWSIALLASGIALGGAYGWRSMDAKCGLLARSVLPSDASYALQKHLAILDALSNGNDKTAKAIAEQMARSEAVIVKECLNSQDCMMYAPSFLSEPFTQHALERASQLEQAAL